MIIKILVRLKKVVVWKIKSGVSLTVIMFGFLDTNYLSKNGKCKKPLLDAYMLTVNFFFIEPNTVRKVINTSNFQDLLRMTL